MFVVLTYISEFIVYLKTLVVFWLIFNPYPANVENMVSS